MSSKGENNNIIVQPSSPVPVIGVGASAGGLEAFKKFLAVIPENSGMVFLLMQHMDPLHHSVLGELLQRISAIPVVVIKGTTTLQADHIYILPSHNQPVIQNNVLQLKPLPKKTNTKHVLPIDLFFIELARVYGANAIGIILSGTATDGTLGLQQIKEAGGITFVQQEESADYSGMPSSAIEAGFADFILPPQEMISKLMGLIKTKNWHTPAEQSDLNISEEAYKQILLLLRIRKGTDFTYYKQPTIRRRILRRMALNKIESLEAYLQMLRENKKEQDILYQDMLIPVTGFFRDPESFENLWQNVLPLMIQHRTDSIIRIWIAGCSTGEEAYSFAISLKELASARLEKIQVFGTDISEAAIMKARAGIYTKAEIEGLSPARLEEFFTETRDGYQVNKSIRDICIFAVHNFLKDPPFGKMDMISCRNVLIYMEPYLQKKAISTFHYALNPKGYLFLGRSETTGNTQGLFSAAGKKEKLFIRNDVDRGFSMPAFRQRQDQIMKDITPVKMEKLKTDFQRSADDIMLRKYAPAGVVVNEEMDIVHFRGNTGKYLAPSPGKASLNILKMAKDSLGFEIRNLLHKSKKDNGPVLKEHIQIEVEGEQRLTSIEAIPLPDMADPHYLILFHDGQANTGINSSHYPPPRFKYG